MNYKGILFLVLSSSIVVSRIAGQTLGSQKHTFAQVYDSVYGIQVYDALNPVTGGDSVRKYAEGTLCNGLVEDYYTDGKLLHKGFYTNGKLTVYTNYYPNGDVERVFKPVTDRKNEMKKYYPSKLLKSDVLYYCKDEMLCGSTSWQDYYVNGQLSYIEEYDKTHQKLLKQCSYYKDGKPLSIFMPLETDKKHLRYSHKEYFANGQLKEEYETLYNPDSSDFFKDGDDKEYDEKGNLVADNEYIGGRLNSKIK